MDDNSQAFQTLTLLVAVCEQASDELDSCDRDTEALRFLIEATRDAATGFARTLDRTGERARVPVPA